MPSLFSLLCNNGHHQASWYSKDSAKHVLMKYVYVEKKMEQYRIIYFNICIASKVFNKAGVVLFIFGFIIILTVMEIECLINLI